MCYFYSVNLLPPSLPFGCQAMDQEDLIGQGCAFGHPDSDSQLANEFSIVAHLERQREQTPSYVVFYVTS